jgi:LysM repeat protein
MPATTAPRSCAIPIRFALLLALLLALAPGGRARAQEGVHIVVPGDTVSEIAAAYGTDVATLRDLNGITGNLIRIGQRLILPAGARAAAAAVPAARAAAGPVRLHTVRPGDTLSELAQRYGVSMDAIMQANGIANPRLIVLGQTLRIPGAAPGAAGEPQQPISPDVPAASKWIDVDLSAQRVVAYEGTRAVRTFRVSTGLPGTPTVTGRFHIRLKIPLQDMQGGSRFSGDAYFISDVPWVQYFFEDYAFHGTHWHTNFGRPASRGCINMTTEDAEWLYYWTTPVYEGGPRWLGATVADPGTLVVIHE